MFQLTCSWVDKRTIYFLSTLHPANVPPASYPPTVKRKNFRWNSDKCAMSSSFARLPGIYERSYRGDQAIAYYNIGRRSTKWWKRIFLHHRQCYFEFRKTGNVTEQVMLMNLTSGMGSLIFLPATIISQQQLYPINNYYHCINSTTLSSIPTVYHLTTEG